MKLLYVMLGFVVFTLGCVDNSCDNFVTYEERIPIYTENGGELSFLDYITYTDVMSSCDCLLLANERSKDYVKYLEGLDVNSKEFEFHTNYPSQYQCR